MMLSKLLPGNDRPENPDDVKSILRNSIYLTNYFPAVRTVLGWKGIFRIAHDRECWTIKTGSSPGIFGIIFNKGETFQDFIMSSFSLFYFPDPREEIIEHFSLKAALMTQQADYLTHVREFPYHNNFSDYYFIGEFYLSFSKKESSFFTGIQALSLDRVIAKDGIRSPENEEKFIVSPGEAEQELPSFSLCTRIFDLLTSTLLYQLQVVPGSLYYRADPGYETIYGREDPPYQSESSVVTVESLVLGFGAGVATDINFDEITGTINTVQPVHSLTWLKGSGEPPERFSQARWWHDWVFTSTLSMDKSLLGIHARPGFYIVSGFLGSGKTSFIKNFIEYNMQKYLFTAVIQNELGEIGLDGLLLSDNSRVIEMDEGCVCCTLAGNLRKGIQRILDDFSPDCIILETTGAANPANLIDEIDDLIDLVRFDSITTIVDAGNIRDTLNEVKVASEQIKSADILVLNKLDMVSYDEQEEIKQLLSGINNRALMVTAAHAAVNPAEIYDTEGHMVHSSADSKKHTHLHDGIESVSIRFTVSIDRQRFTEIIESLGDEVFRIKGLLNFKDSESTEIFQYVCGRYDLTPSDMTHDSPGYLVFIGKNLDAVKLNSFFNQVQV